MTVAVAAAGRSPFTRVGGALAGWHPVDLTAAVITALVERAGLGPDQIDEVWVGCAEPVGAQGADLARAAALAAGWPDRIGGTVIDRAESSGLAALHAAAAAIASGSITRAVVVGVGCASVVAPGASALARTYGRPWGDGPGARVAERGGLLPPPAAADAAARAAGIDRTAQDEWTRVSHRRRRAQHPGTIVAVEARPGDQVAIQRGTPIADDDHRDGPDGIEDLPPAFDPDGTVTGATFAPAIDGVAAVLLGPGPPGSSTMGELIGVARAAGDPLDPTGDVATAVDHALGAAGLSHGDIDVWALTEPTAATALLSVTALGIDPELVNPGGGTLAVGDAGAAEEIRLVVDGLAGLAPGQRLVAASMGPTGSAATILRRP